MLQNRILLVEDDDSLRLTQAMYLEREGFEVTAVGSGGEALRRIATDQYHAERTLSISASIALSFSRFPAPMKSLTGRSMKAM